MAEAAEAERGEIAWTDPPWSVAYGKAEHPSWKRRAIANDDLGAAFPEFARAFAERIARHLVPGAPLYLAMSAQEWPTIHRVLVEAGFHWSSTIIWAKDRLVLSRKDYHTQYEPIWYGWKEPGPRIAPLRDRTQSDLWEIPRPATSAEHPTMKPVELVRRSLRVVHQRNLPRTPQHNAWSERGMRELKEASEIEGCEVYGSLNEAAGRLVAGWWRVDREVPRRVSGWRTREVRYARMAPWYPRVDREDFFRTACAAVEQAVRGASTARGRRIAERGAIYATLERFELIRRTRGGAPLEGVKGDG